MNKLSLSKIKVILILPGRSLATSSYMLLLRTVLMRPFGHQVTHHHHHAYIPIVASLLCEFLLLSFLHLLELLEIHVSTLAHLLWDRLQHELVLPLLVVANGVKVRLVVGLVHLTMRLADCLMLRLMLLLRLILCHYWWLNSSTVSSHVEF